MTWPVSTDPQDSDALKWFLEKVPVTKDVWDAMSQEARRKAFTVAGVTKADLLTQVHEAIAKAIKEGTGLAQFKKDVRAKLLSAWGEQVANPAWRIETISRTNVQNAYSAGRWKQMTHPTIRKVRPYMMFDAVMDNRVSHICEKLDGTVLPTEEWEKRGLVPPLHFNCRSALRSLRKSQAEKQDKFGEEPPDVQAQDGFGSPVVEWKPDATKYPPGIRERVDEILSQASELGPRPAPLQVKPRKVDPDEDDVVPTDPWQDSKPGEKIPNPS